MPGKQILSPVAGMAISAIPITGRGLRRRNESPRSFAWARLRARFLGLRLSSAAARQRQREIEVGSNHHALTEPKNKRQKFDKGRTICYNVTL